MDYTNESKQIQKYINNFDKIACENLTKKRADIIKSFFVKLNKYHYQQPRCISRMSVTRNFKTIKTDLFNYIPDTIRLDIENNYKTLHITTFLIHSKTVTYHIYNKTELNSEVANQMIYKMNLWLSIAMEAAENNCSNKLDVHLHLTDHKKTQPEENVVISRIHANTALTTSCSQTNVIYIYRKEEWFKVFIHECFHCLGLDFSQMDAQQSNACINQLFSTQIEDIRLYETYCETWAETFNLIFIAFFRTISKVNYDEMFQMFQDMFNVELTFSIYQMISILDKSNIRYIDIVRSNNTQLYSENTNVFSYYIIKPIIMFQMNHFITWCLTNNKNIIDFTNTENNVSKFCEFIELYYDNAAYLKAVTYIEKQPKFKTKTLRMTAFDLI